MKKKSLDFWHELHYNMSEGSSFPFFSPFVLFIVCVFIVNLFSWESDSQSFGYRFFIAEKHDFSLVSNYDISSEMIRHVAMLF